MSEKHFKSFVILLLFAMLVAVGSILSSAGLSAQIASIVAPGSLKPSPESPDDLLANQLIDRVTRLRDRAISVCSGVVTHMRVCKEVREAANYAYSNVIEAARLSRRSGSGVGLIALSRGMDTAEAEAYRNLQTMEEQSKIIENTLSGR
jgi:hypothetical protein